MLHNAFMDEMESIEAVPEDNNVDNKDNVNEEITHEGVFDMFKTVKYNIKTTERVLRLVASLTRDNEDDKHSFVNNIVLIYAAGDKLIPSAINNGIKILEKFLSSNTKRIIIATNYKDDDMKYKASDMTRFYKHIVKFVDDQQKDRAVFQEAVYKVFSDGFGVSYAKKVIVAADDNKLKMEKSDLQILKKYVYLVDRVATAISREYELVKDEPTLTRETAVDDEMFIDKAEDLTINFEEVIKTVKSKKDATMAETIGELLEKRLCDINK